MVGAIVLDTEGATVTELEHDLLGAVAVVVGRATAGAGAPTGEHIETGVELVAVGVGQESDPTVRAPDDQDVVESVVVEVAD